MNITKKLSSRVLRSLHASTQEKLRTTALTLAIRRRYFSSISPLSWQPASNCHTSPRRASGTPDADLTRVRTPEGRRERSVLHWIKTSPQSAKTFSEQSMLTSPEPLSKGSSLSKRIKILAYVVRV